MPAKRAGRGLTCSDICASAAAPQGELEAESAILTDGLSTGAATPEGAARGAAGWKAGRRNCHRQAKKPAACVNATCTHQERVNAGKKDPATTVQKWKIFRVLECVPAFVSSCSRALRVGGSFAMGRGKG